MNSDLDIQRAVEAGQRNQEVKELIQNWCGHARVEKLGGTGLIEEQTGLPIGHHSMACDHAHARGMGTWFLEESAVHFHDSHCVACTKRQPIRLPNISKLIDRRDRDAARERARHEEFLRQQQEALSARSAVRTSLRSTSSVAVATFLDDLHTFDSQRDESVAARLIQSARLAPEILTGEVIEHLFSLLESGEHWFDSVGLTILSEAQPLSARLAHCAMRCLRDGCTLDLAAVVAADCVSCIEAEDVRDAVAGLAYVACPIEPFPQVHEPDKANPLPLEYLHAQFPKEVALGIEDLLSEEQPFRVRLGARAVVVLAPKYPMLPITLRRSIATRLVRAEMLIAIEDESELREVTHDLSKALVCAFMADPDGTDAELMRYFEGASKDGEARLSGVYEHVVRQGCGNFRDDGEEITDFEPYRIALRRLMRWADTSENEEVIQDVLQALRGDPDRLAPIAREQIEIFLGAAALMDAKLAAQSEEKPSVITPTDWLASMDKSNRRSRLYSLRASFVRWAIHGAIFDASGLPVLTDLLDKSHSLSEDLHAAIIEELPPLLKTGAGLSAALPFLYTAMVGRSNWIRSAAAKAIGEIRYRGFEELPSLVAEAFLMMLSDRYVIVHKAAVRALRQIRLPDEFREQVAGALRNLVVVYRGDQDQEFFLMCLEAYASEERRSEHFDAQLGRIIMALLEEVKPKLLVTKNRQWLVRSLCQVKGYAELVFGLFEHCDNEYDLEHVLHLVREIPRGTAGRHIAAIKKTAASCSSEPLVIGTLLEVLSRDGEWSAASEVIQLQLDAVPNTTLMRVRQLAVKQQLFRTDFERLIAQGKVEEALAVGKSWDEASVEIDQIREENEKTDSFRSIHPSSHGS